MSSNTHKRPAPFHPSGLPPSKVQKSSSSTQRSMAAPETPSVAKLEAQLVLFTRERLQKLLVKVARENSVVANAIGKEVEAIRRIMAQAPPIDFQPLSSRVWHTLNIKYNRLRPSQQFEIVGNVENEIEEVIEDGILAKVNKDVCFATKYNALSVLRKMGKSIMLTEDGEIAKGVQNGGVLDTLTDAMRSIAEMMTPEERKATLLKGSLSDELEELNDLRDCYMDGLPDVLGLFGIGDGDGEDVEEEEDDGDQSEDDEDPLKGEMTSPPAMPVASARSAAASKQLPTMFIDLTT